MVRARACLVTAIVFLGWVCMISVAAAQGSQFVVPRAGVEAVLAGFRESWGPVHTREGEIVALERRICRLNEGGVVNDFPFAATCTVFANGLPACPEAVRPVSPEYGFWAKLWIDGDGTVRLVEAVYLGGELLLTAVSRESLIGLLPERQTLITLQTTAGLSIDGLAPGQLVYVLLDLDGRVRQAKHLSSSLQPWQEISSRLSK